MAGAVHIVVLERGRPGGGTGPQTLGPSEQHGRPARIVSLRRDGREHDTAGRGGDPEFVLRVDAVPEPARVSPAESSSASVAAATAAPSSRWSRCTTAIPVRASNITGVFLSRQRAVQRAEIGRLGPSDVAFVEECPSQAGDQ